MTLATPDPAREALSLAADAAPDLESAPSYYRLDEAAWAMIGEQYRAGATARQLSKAWRVSAGSIYRHAGEGGWTKSKRAAEVSTVMVARERERQAFAEVIAGEAEAAEAPREVDPLSAARTLMRRGAGSAMKGRGEQAKLELSLATDLVRCARMLAEAEGAIASVRGVLVQEARQALAADPDWTEPGWRDREENAALDAQIIAGLKRYRRKRGRMPPQELPAFVWLVEYPQYRALAEALGVVDGDDNAVCPDFEAAVQACRDAGRGELLNLALETPLPLALCPWLEPEQKAQIAAEEAANAAAFTVWEEEPNADEGVAEEPPPHSPPEPPPLRLGEPAAPWAHLCPPSPGLAPRLRFIGGP